MTVFETMQEEEIKTLSSSLLITDPCKPLSYITPRLLLGEWGAQCWRHKLTAFASLPAENKSHLSISSKLSAYFFIWLLWAKKAKILAGNSFLSRREVTPFLEVLFLLTANTIRREGRFIADVPTALQVNCCSLS